jgi:hypothetical protein
MTDQSKALFEEILAGYDPPVPDLARAVRALIYDVMPPVVEVVWMTQRTVGYGTGPKKMSEHFCYIALHKKHVNLGFNYGSELPDPENLLEGSGQLFRHIKIRSDKDWQNPAVRALVKVASTHRVPPPKSG